MDTVRKEVESLKDEVIKLRRDFHMHPELAFKEKRTAKQRKRQNNSFKSRYGCFTNRGNE